MKEKLSRCLKACVPYYERLCNQPGINYKFDFSSLFIAVWMQVTWQEAFDPLDQVFGLLQYLLATDLLTSDQNNQNSRQSNS
jgi:hypothetical protein